MNIYSKNKVLTITLALLTGAILSSCATMQDMEVLGKQLEEGKLVPAEVVKHENFINQYDHKLPAPKNKLLQVSIEMEKDNLMVRGDSLYVQVGLVSKKPRLKAKNYHFLVPNMLTTPDEQLTLMKETIKQFHQHMNTLPAGSRLSVDWMKPAGKPEDEISGLLADEPTSNLETFIRRFVRIPSLGNKDHFILLLGDHGRLSYDEKQNIIDLANIFRIKGASLSVLSVANKAEVAFLNKMTNKSDGLLNLHTKAFDYIQWMQSESSYINANKIKDIKLSINSINGASISQVVAPGNIYPSKNNTDKNKIKHNIKQLVQGENYVILAKLNTPVIKQFFNRKIIDVEVEYYDVANNRYVKDKRSAKVNFVYDRNKTINKENKFVKRTKLILDTQNIISDIVPVIRDKRYYQAAGLLTEHSIKLEQFANKFNDKQLHRDAKIFFRYANKLFDYNEESFEAIKTWYDLSWDTDRFSEQYQ